MGMTDEERMVMIRQIVNTQLDANNDDEGDKHLSSADEAMEAIGIVLDSDSLDDPFMRRITREGWFTGTPAA
jgi:hypothetical protein